MRKLTKKEIPYILTSLLFALATNQITYQGTKLITMNRYHWNIMLPLDHEIPLVSWTVLIYFGSYIFWVVWLAAVALQNDRHESERLFCSALIAKMFCFVIFIAFPTTMTRPEITGNSIFDWLMRFLFAADHPVNLFPSLHVISSWLCWMGVRGKKEFPFAFRLSALLISLAVCACILTVRQHVIVDILGGILVAEVSHLIAKSDAVVSIYSRISMAIMRKVFKKKDLES